MHHFNALFRNWWFCWRSQYVVSWMYSENCIWQQNIRIDLLTSIDDMYVYAYNIYIFCLCRKILDHGDSKRPIFMTNGRWSYQLHNILYTYVVHTHTPCILFINSAGGMGAIKELKNLQTMENLLGLSQ